LQGFAPSVIARAKPEAICIGFASPCCAWLAMTISSALAKFGSFRYFNFMVESINWSLFLTSQFWLGIDRFGGISLADKIILWTGVALLALGIILLVYRLLTKNVLLKPVIGRVSSVFIVVGLLEMLWFLLRSQFVNTLGARITAVIIGLIGLGFLYGPLKYFIKQYRQDKVNYQKQQVKEKYLQQ
jgi:hypothetical protein